MIRPILVVALGALGLTACATTPDAPSGPPDFTAIATHPSDRARLYSDCIGQAIARNAYGRASDGDAELILFTCQDGPARAFYDGLAERAAAVGSEVQAEGRTFRSTNRVQRNLIGVDYCSTDGEGDHECVITLNAGEFLRD